MESKKQPQEFEITELFLVKAGNDYKRTFIGQIYRETTKEGISIVRGVIGKCKCLKSVNKNVSKFSKINFRFSEQI